MAMSVNNQIEIQGLQSLCREIKGEVEHTLGEYRLQLQGVIEEIEEAVRQGLELQQQQQFVANQNSHAEVEELMETNAHLMERLEERQRQH